MPSPPVGTPRTLLLAGAALAALAVALSVRVLTQPPRQAAPAIAPHGEPSMTERPPVAGVSQDEGSYHTEIYHTRVTEEAAEPPVNLEELLDGVPVDDAPVEVAIAAAAPLAEPMSAPAPVLSAPAQLPHAGPLQLEWRPAAPGGVDELTAWVEARGGVVIPTTERHVIIRLPRPEVTACLIYLQDGLSQMPDASALPPESVPWAAMSVTLLE